jgi:hypothetical protein
MDMFYKKPIKTMTYNDKFIKSSLSHYIFLNKTLHLTAQHALWVNASGEFGR